MTRTQLEELAKRLELGHVKLKALADAVRFNFDDSYLLEAAALLRSLLAQEPVSKIEARHVITDSFGGKRVIYSIADSFPDDLEIGTSLYAAPVPAVDLEAFRSEAMRLHANAIARAIDFAGTDALSSEYFALKHDMNAASDALAVHLDTLGGK
jgi:hypothetical protein